MSNESDNQTPPPGYAEAKPQRIHGEDWLRPGEFDGVVTAALAEDIGQGDITSQLTIPKKTQARIDFVARGEMVACGTFVPQEVYRQLDKMVRVQALVKEGQLLAKGDVLVTAEGPARALLAGERTALNIMQRMCGVATLTATYVEAVRGTKAIILDTRKTMPGLRALDKYAVKTGGGQNHRMRLDDMVLIKDNHIALCGGISAAIEHIRKRMDSRLHGNDKIKIVIECDTLAQVKEALAAGPDRVLLDNMSLAELHKAVALGAGKIPLEASGGVSLATVRAIAETGVDYISVGAITHSASAVDIAGDITIRS